MKTVSKIILVCILLTGLIEAKQKDAGWYLRTVVTATTADNKSYTHATAGVFGLLKQSRNKKDRHDISAYGEKGAILQILFTPTHWGKNNGNYFSNYKHYNRKKPFKRSVWQFKVRNPRSVDLKEAELKIRLQGPYKITFTKKEGRILYTESPYPHPRRIFRRLKLVDVDNHRVYRYREFKNLTLSMDGLHTRSFRWVLGKIKPRDFRAF